MAKEKNSQYFSLSLKSHSFVQFQTICQFLGILTFLIVSQSRLFHDVHIYCTQWLPGSRLLMQRAVSSSNIVTILIISLSRNSLAVQWLGFHANTTGSTGSVPGQGTKMPHAVHPSQKKKEKKIQKTFICVQKKWFHFSTTYRSQKFKNRTFPIL